MNYGMIIKNPDGDTLVDSNFLNYSLGSSGVTDCGVGVTQVSFKASINSANLPIICVAQWSGAGLIGGITVLGAPGAWTGISVRVRGAAIKLDWQVYATDLPPGERWTLSVFNEKDKCVFDAGRRMLTFSGEISGETSGWVKAGGSPFVNGRDDLFHYGTSPVKNGQYVALGLLAFAFFGLTNSNFGPVSVVTEVGFGWESAGRPLLFLESFMDAPAGTFPYGIPGAVFFDLPSMPILNI
ncbi:hypothetical protein LGQ10_12890 [Pseudomonas sp. L5B5]|uniref:hypothetical protein n=1 Tax=Pseudomonas sp. L5B5 TaxID=2883205 RepID=UPI001CFBC205|nr:hypothetical protein [Pseudomonas sp. L5B5]UCZ87146.1 hypothetical protein LGQ10_12890 [Pseudomonas sp. L5B5]